MCVVITLVNVLALEAARKIDVAHEDVALVKVAVAIAVVRAAATASAHIARYEHPCLETLGKPC
jgi:hypothetical protein